MFQGLREFKPVAEAIGENVVPAKRKLKAADSIDKGPRSRGVKPSKISRDDVRLPSKQLRALEGVRLTRSDRMLYPGDGITFHATIADWILPHVTNRLLSPVRCPRRRRRKTLLPEARRRGDGVHRVPVVEDRSTETCLMIDDLAGLLSLVQMSVLEIHPWGSRTDDVERPDRIGFDLDPDPSVAWPRVVEGAQEVRSRLGDLKLESFVKTTGGKGLHVVVPHQRRHTWDEVKRFSKAFAARMAADAPSRYTAGSALLSESAGVCAHQ